MDGDAAIAAQADCHGERDQFPGLGIKPACLLTGIAESDVSFFTVSGLSFPKAPTPDKTCWR